jgi:hypothetical protein
VIFLAHVVADLPGGRHVAAAEIADAFMAVDAIVTVKVLDDGACAECRIDVQGPTRADAARRAVAATEAAARLAGLDPAIVAVKLQTAAERAAALEAAR